MNFLFLAFISTSTAYQLTTQFNQNAIDNIVAQLDTDGNGVVSQQEFSKSIDSISKLQAYDGVERPTFNDIDADGDGLLTKPEIASYLQFNGEIDLEKVETGTTPKIQEHTRKVYKKMSNSVCPAADDSKAWSKLKNCKDESCPLFECLASQDPGATDAKKLALSKEMAVKKGMLVGSIITGSLIMLFIIYMFFFAKIVAKIVFFPLTVIFIIAELFIIRKIVDSYTQLKTLEALIKNK
jgi:hypothetical protein